MSDIDETDPSEESEEERGISLKWALAGVTLFAVLAIVVATTLFFGRSDSGKDSSTAAPTSSSKAPAAKIASAGDTGPVEVIVEDPSCAAWTSINNSLANDGTGIWNERDRSVPASAWDKKQRAQFMAAGQSMRNAAAQAVGLVALTPHRVMRELYEQFIAYAREYTSRIPKYTPADDKLAGTANSAASALGAICAAIADGSAGARGPLVAPQGRSGQSAPPSPPANPTNPRPFLIRPNPVCGDWKATLAEFRSKTAAWQKIDPIIPAMLWNQEQKAANYAVAPIINTYADKLEQLGLKSGNPVWQDFADLAAQYGRAFALAVPTYTPADNHLANTGVFASTTILGACAVSSGA